MRRYNNDKRGGIYGRFNNRSDWMYGDAVHDRDNMIRVLELFAGIGSCSKALTRLGIDHTIVDAVEIDKYAVQAFNAIHGTNFKPQDIRAWDKDIECDLIMHGSPCQDFSIAGKQAGGDEGSGTRSSLMYETLRIVEKLKPKYVIWENVKNLLSKKHRHNFDAYLEAMEKLGYKNYHQVLNAKHYGVPQNRERVFTISILGGGDFQFPEPIPLKKKLKDVLEKEVDEKYYLSEDKAKTLKFSNISKTIRSSGRGSLDRHSWDIVKVGDLDIKGQDQIRRVYDSDGISPTLSTMQGGNRQPKIVEDFYKNREPRVYNETSPTLRSERTGLKVVEPFIVASRGRNPDHPSDRTAGVPTEQRLEPRFDGTTNTITTVQKDNYVAIRTANRTGYDLATDGDGIDFAYPESRTRRGRVGHGVSKTIPTSDSQGVLDGMRIRKLTPLSCWRLMGFDDEDFDKAKSAGLSNTQLYKQAGNSIVVNVLEAILTNLLEEK